MRVHVCKLCGHPRDLHEPHPPVDGEPAIWECPDRTGYVTPEQFELRAYVAPAAQSDVWEESTGPVS